MSGNYIDLQVTGLKKTINDLNKLGTKLQDMKGVMHEAGSYGLIRIKPLVPVRTGHLVSTLRASQSKNHVIIRAGGRLAPYAKIIDEGGRVPLFGDRAHWVPIPRKDFMKRGASDAASGVESIVRRGLQRIIDGLNEDDK